MTIHKQESSALEQVDSRPLNRQYKSLISLVVVLNISGFFDMSLIGLVVPLLTKSWNLSGIQTGITLTCSRLETLVDAAGVFIVASSTGAGSPARGWFSSTASSSQ